MKRILTFLTFCLILGSASAQQKVSVHELKTTAPHKDFMSGLEGIKVDLDLYFSTYSESYYARSFDLDYVLVTPAGQVVFDSKSGQTVKVVGAQNTDTRIPAPMVDTDVVLFAPFKDINLPSGSQTLSLILSLKNDYANFPDFYQTKVTFQHVHLEQKKLADQVFQVQKTDIAYNADGFGTTDPGMDINFKVGLQFGANQLDTKEYKIDLSVLSTDGKTVLYSTKKDPCIHHHYQTLQTEKFPGEPKKMSFFVSYVVLQMNQAGEAIVILEAEQPGIGTREIYREKMLLQTPTKYRFADQVFTPTNSGAVQNSRDGIKGVNIGFHCNYKYTTPLIDAEKGDYYFFVVLTNAKGDTVFSPTYLRRVDYGTTKAWDPHNPMLETAGGSVGLFVPFHRMKLAQGTHTLNYTVFVSDKARKTRFPTVLKGSVDVNMPQKLKYDVHVSNLSVISGNYDTQIAVFGSPLPDLEWRLELGDDTEYQSKTIENSLSAATGSSSLTLCEGDKVTLGLWDIDSGFFNRNDILGRWEIPMKFEGTTYQYDIQSQGAISSMSVTITRK